MQTTTNYGYNVPESGDPSDISKISENFTKIDNDLKSVSDTAASGSSDLAQKIDAVGTKVDGVEDKVDTLTTKVDNINSSVEGLPTSLESDFTEVKDAISDVKTDVGGLPTILKTDFTQVNQTIAAVKTDTEKLLDISSDGFNDYNLKDLVYVDGKVNVSNMGSDVEIVNITGKGYLYAISCGYDGNPLSTITGTILKVKIDDSNFTNIKWDSNYEYTYNFNNYSSAIIVGSKAVYPYTLLRGSSYTNELISIDKYKTISKENPYSGNFNFNSWQASLKPVPFNKLKITLNVRTSTPSSDLTKNLVTRVHYRLEE